MKKSITWQILSEQAVEFDAKRDVKALFDKIIELWVEQSHSINRRITGSVLVNDEDKERLIREVPAGSADHVEVRKFVTKTEKFSENAYEASFFEEDLLVRFWPIVEDNKEHPHVPSPYSIGCVQGDEKRVKLRLLGSATEDPKSYWFLQTVAFPQVFKWFCNVDPSKERRITNCLMNIENYSKRYRQLKETIGRAVCEKWEEKTDPQKFVFEDCGISTYLLELFDSGICPKPKKFVDVGCGNGLLVHILNEEKIPGYGVDVRKRKIWDSQFARNDLRENSVDPSKFEIGKTFDDDTDFLIGNHSDELTPWIPVMAARMKANFFLLPCCPFNFFGKFDHRSGRKKGTETKSQYECFFEFVVGICQKLGFDVKTDRLAIPSTKRLCLVCTVPDGGLPENLNEIIEDLTKVGTFVARPHKIEMRNCMNVSLENRQKLTKFFFNHLLNLSDDVTDGWHCGGTEKLSNLVSMLSQDDKNLMKAQDGGLQTFLRNQHQVFHVYGGECHLRDMRKALQPRKSKPSQKKKEGSRAACFMNQNHPDGCPVGATYCRFFHEEK